MSSARLAYNAPVFELFFLVRVFDCSSRLSDFALCCAACVFGCLQTLHSPVAGPRSTAALIVGKMGAIELPQVSEAIKLSVNFSAGSTTLTLTNCQARTENKASFSQQLKQLMESARKRAGHLDSPLVCPSSMKSSSVSLLCHCVVSPHNRSFLRLLSSFPQYHTQYYFLL